VATPEQKAKVLALAQDLPRVWHAPTTQSKDRKRMLRLLLKDITVDKPSPSKQLLLHLCWQGDASCLSRRDDAEGLVRRPVAAESHLLWCLHFNYLATH
jgi:hypothetical protein